MICDYDLILDWVLILIVCQSVNSIAKIMNECPKQNLFDNFLTSFAINTLQNVTMGYKQENFFFCSLSSLHCFVPPFWKWWHRPLLRWFRESIAGAIDTKLVSIAPAIDSL